MCYKWSTKYGNMWGSGFAKVFWLCDGVRVFDCGSHAQRMVAVWWCAWQKMMKEIGDRKRFAVGVERIEKK